MGKKGLKIIAIVTSLMLLLSIINGCKASSEDDDNKTTGSKKQKKLTLLIDNQTSLDGLKSTATAFEKKTGIKTEIELRPGGAEGDNTLKTRLATGEMADLCAYNSGSLFVALGPENNFVDLTEEPFMDKVMDSFKKSVSVNDKVYGIPVINANGGGWLYNKKVYEELNLSVPKTWDKLLENCEKIKAAKKVPVIASYKDSWTAQLIVLADYYNVSIDNPEFAEDYTANKVKFAKNKSALRGFEKLQEVHKKNYINEDSLSTTTDLALKMLTEGTGVHYPMLTFMVENIASSYPDKIEDIGFFAQPGDDADKNGLTIWLSSGIYIYKNSENIDAAKEWAEFYISEEGIDAYLKKANPSGPFMIKDVELPDDTYPCIKDMVKYIDEDKIEPALEFLTPLKGPNLPQICVEAGSSIKTPLECAEEYDKDVEKQAKQLDLKGW
ncbi:MAG: extracellular solute-binding protein [Clostridiales bacterium]